MKESMDTREYKINILESKEIDLGGAKHVKKVRGDDYDYEDGFLEPFEGDTDAVELECKLEDFFVYKGRMTEDAKKIVRKYKNYKNVQKTSKFEFENNIQRTSRKFVKFYNEILFLLHCEIIDKTENITAEDFISKKIIIDNFLNPIEDTVDDKIPNTNSLELSNNKLVTYENIPELSNEDVFLYLKNLQEYTIPTLYKEIRDMIGDTKNYSGPSLKYFEFKNIAFIDLVIQFTIAYYRFYYNELDEFTKNKPILIVTRIFPLDCTNTVKLRYFMLKKIESTIKTKGYDVDSVGQGKFVINKEVEKQLD